MDDLEPTLQAFERQTACTLTLYDRMHMLAISDLIPFEISAPPLPDIRQSHEAMGYEAEKRRAKLLDCWAPVGRTLPMGSEARRPGLHRGDSTSEVTFCRTDGFY